MTLCDTHQNQSSDTSEDTTNAGQTRYLRNKEIVSKLNIEIQRPPQLKLLPDVGSEGASHGHEDLGDEVYEESKADTVNGQTSHHVIIHSAPSGVSLSMLSNCGGHIMYTVQQSRNIEEGRFKKTVKGVVRMVAEDVFSHIQSSHDCCYFLCSPSLEMRTGEFQHLLVGTVNTLVTGVESLLYKLFATGKESHPFSDTVMNQVMLRIEVQGRRKSKKDFDEDAKCSEECLSLAIRQDQEDEIVCILSLKIGAGSERECFANTMIGGAHKEEGKMNGCFSSLYYGIPELKMPSHFNSDRINHSNSMLVSANTRMGTICCANPSDVPSTLQLVSGAKLVKAQAQIDEILGDRIVFKELKRELADAKKYIIENQSMHEERDLAELLAAKVSEVEYFALTQVQGLMAKIEEVQLQLAQTCSERESLYQQNVALEEQIQMLLSNIENLNQNMAESEALIELAESLAMKMSDAEDAALIQVQLAVVKVKEVQAEKESLSQENAALKLQIFKVEEMQSKDSSMGAETAVLMAQVKELQSQLMETHLQKDQLRQANEDTSEKIRSVSSINKRLTKELSKGEDFIEELLKLVKKISREKSSCLNCIKGWMTKLKEVQYELSLANDEKEDLRERNIALEDQMQVLSSIVEELNEYCNQNESSIAHLTEERNQAIDQAQKLKGDVEELQLQLVQLSTEKQASDKKDAYVRGIFIVMFYALAFYYKKN